MRKRKYADPPIHPKKESKIEEQKKMMTMAI